MTILLQEMEVISGISTVKRGPLYENWDRDQWLTVDITEEQANLYPAAKKARDFKNTKLYKAMK